MITRTIPANAAVAVNADLEYSLVSISKTESEDSPALDCDYLIVASELIEALSAKSGLDLAEEERFKVGHLMAVS